MKRYSLWLKVTASILAAFFCASIICILLLVDKSHEGEGIFNNRYSFADVLGASTFVGTSVYGAERDFVLEKLNRIETLTIWLEQWERGNRFPTDQRGEQPFDYYGSIWSAETIMMDLRNTLTLLDMMPGVYYFCHVAGYEVTYSNPKNVYKEWFINFDHTHTSVQSGNKIMVFTDTYINEMERDYSKYREETEDKYYLLLLLSTLAAASVAYLFFTSGKKANDDKIYLHPIDGIYTEFIIVLLAGFIYGGVLLIKFLYPSLAPNKIWYFVSITSLTAVIYCIGTVFFSIVRRMKDGSLWYHSLIFAIFSAVGEFLQDTYFSGTSLRRAAASVIVMGVLTMIPYAGFVTVPLSVWMVVKTLKGIMQEQEKQLNEQVRHRTRAEHMRTELISNVSHDIRTPLTSVITYIELLKEENIDSERAKSYISVIENKAQRLKVMTDDLFEASKAASGNIPVSLEELDLNALISQGLGEMSSKMDESKLEFRILLWDEPILVKADGQLLWRIVENMMENVFKYALPKSRVYIETRINGEMGTLSVKNISAKELNLTADELLERFKRGDESRSGTGSGLGLSIANSLSAAMGGRFEITIDGDLFKAAVLVPKV